MNKEGADYDYADYEASTEGPDYEAYKEGPELFIAPFTAKPSSTLTVTSKSAPAISSTSASPAAAALSSTSPAPAISSTSASPAPAISSTSASPAAALSSTSASPAAALSSTSPAPTISSTSAATAAAPPSPQPAPPLVVPAATFRSYSLGCFALDVAAGAAASERPPLPFTLAANDPGMTVARCAALAQAAGVDHYGLTGGTTCLGGVSREQATRGGALPESACDRPCAGDARQKCGGGPASVSQQQPSAVSLYSFVPASPPPRPPQRPPRRPTRPGTAAKPPKPPAPAPPQPTPPSPSRQAETDALLQTAAADLPALQQRGANSQPLSLIATVPAARSLILLQPTAVPVYTAALAAAASAAPAGAEQQQQLQAAPVVASARVGRGRLVVFGSEAMLTGCCDGDNGTAAATAAAAEINAVIANAAAWALAAGSVTPDRKAVIRVSDPRLDPLARSDVYIVLGANPQQSYIARIRDALRAFVEDRGKGILLAGPLVLEASLSFTAAAAPVPSDEWTRPDLMFAKQNGVTAGGAASAVAAGDVASLHFRETLSQLLELKGQPQQGVSAELVGNLKARVASVRSDLAASDVAAMDELLRARIEEYDGDVAAGAL
ncbi:hypothetical protein HYH02_012446 [Chlamydomonas schloesseri]|uniref:WSC domain-containing protein n=1 Tax=Chlamydomonas schloesseri TaxID=2026947 RepID=A0A835T525_9CHLO|nr:hypothetical protein HYH02_012446 [Chlamydomonas schloesseri]|eukprot:KAG2433984.1 hypothetical protein HYH02_012446 [Chlamydomonas schloesseri]